MAGTSGRGRRPRKPTSKSAAKSPPKSRLQKASANAGNPTPPQSVPAADSHNGELGESSMSENQLQVLTPKESITEHPARSADTQQSDDNNKLEIAFQVGHELTTQSPELPLNIQVAENNQIVVSRSIENDLGYLVADALHTTIQDLTSFVAGPLYVAFRQPSNNVPVSRKVNENDAGNSKNKDISPVLSKEPPLIKLEDIFQDITERAMKHGFDQVVEALKGKVLKVGTLCSGTESPILALQLFQKALKDHHGRTIEFEHIFSAEIEPFKQAYIERNFKPRVLFRDVEEFYDEKATTVYGGKAEIPGDADILIAGFSCVDYSNLNNLKKRFYMDGESYSTLCGVVAYVKQHHPRLVVLENVINTDWKEVQNVFNAEDVDYSTVVVRVDSKDYYLPQTRQRKYLFAIRNDGLSEPERANATQKFEQLMTAFERPCSATFIDFMLDDDDHRLQAFKLTVACSYAKDQPGKQAKWTRCKERHLSYRTVERLGILRQLTQWQNNGSCHPPDFYWTSWVKAQVERIWDSLEVAHLRCLVRGYDMSYKTRYIDISQNIDRDEETKPWGIVGCVTPDGAPFITTRGGPMVGLESLSLQGLPIETLSLTRETPRQLQDLAGNAMTSTVVGCATLSALLAALSLRSVSDGPLALGGPANTPPNLATPLPQFIGNSVEHLTQTPLILGPLRDNSVADVSGMASKGSQLCRCEGGLYRKIRPFHICRSCGHTCCQKCKGNPMHQFENISVEELKKRIDPGDFEAFIKRALPMRIILKGIAVDDFHHSSNIKIRSELIEAITTAQDEELQFCSVRRGHSWLVTYKGNRSRLELSISPVMELLDRETSGKARDIPASTLTWSWFVEPKKSESSGSPLRALLQKPLAQMQPRDRSLLHGKWRLSIPKNQAVIVKVVGEEPQPSYEARQGLLMDEFKDAKVCRKLHVSYEEGVDTTEQKDNEETGDLKAARKLGARVSGTYLLLDQCGTACGSLYAREKAHAASTPMFLFQDPAHFGEPSNDRFVFAASHHRLPYRVKRQIIASIEPALSTHDDEQILRWRPGSSDCYHAKVMAHEEWHEAALQLEEWQDVVMPELWVTQSRPFFAEDHDNCQDAIQTAFRCSFPLGTLLRQNHPLGTHLNMNLEDNVSALTELKWLIERVSQLEGFGTLKKVPIDQNAEFSCDICAPFKPAPVWKLDKLGKKVILVEDPEEATTFERKLKNRPPPVTARLSVLEDGTGTLDIGINLQSIMHCALAHLLTTSITDDMGPVSWSWGLATETTGLRSREKTDFTLLSNEKDSEYRQPAKFGGQIGHKLRNDQLKLLSWAVNQETSGGIAFDEEEVEEIRVPSLSWRIEGAVSKTTYVRGGILADEVGFGKTVIALALVADQPQPSTPLVVEDLISSRATLVLLPPHLLKQWADETKKFMSQECKCLKVDNLKDFRKYTIKQFKEADIILFNWAILGNLKYLQEMQNLADAPGVPNKAGRHFATWLKVVIRNLKSLKPHMDPYSAAGLKATWLEHRKPPGEYPELVKPSVRGKKKPTAKKRKSKKRKRDEAEEDEAEEDEAEENEAEESEVDESETYAPQEPDFTKQHPYLQLFRFHRIIVDEFTYLKERSLDSVMSLATTNKWLLSGTPPIDGFLGVKHMAALLGVSLGRNRTSWQASAKDDAEGTLIKKKQKGNREAAEEFQAYSHPPSTAWHAHRDAKAKKFLEIFVRQNTAVTEKEVQLHEHLETIELTLVETVIYFELLQQMNASGLTEMKERSNRLGRVTSLTEGCNYAEEALLKCAAGMLGKAGKGTSARNSDTSAFQTCSDIVEDRKAESYDHLGEMYTLLKYAFRLHYQAKNPPLQFTSLLDHIEDDSFGDSEVTHILKIIVRKAANERHEKYGWEKELKTLLKEENAKKTKATKAAKAAKATKATNAAQAAAGGEDEVLEPAPKKQKQTASSKEKEPAKGQPEAGEVQKSDKAKEPKKEEAEIRDRTEQLTTYVGELVAKVQCLRFSQAISKCMGLETAICDGCHSAVQDLQDVQVLGKCGHLGCKACLTAPERLRTSVKYCVHEGCEAPAGNFNVFDLTDFNTGAEISVNPYGTKVAGVLNLLRSIPQDEKALIFIQFESIMAMMISALEDSSIGYRRVKGTISVMNNAVMEFQSTTMNVKVLLLTMGDQSAAGLNLTAANHVIFVSPFLASTQYKYCASKTQAVGRARRYGQKKMVHVYQFLALKTMDVNLFEDREKWIVGFHGGRYALLEKESADAVGPFRGQPFYGRHTEASDLLDD